METIIQKKLVWIDCDIGHDDFLTVVMAAFSDQVELVGISTTFGNSDIENTTKNALNTIKLLNLEDQINVYQGQSHPISRELNLNLYSFHGPKGLCINLPESQKQPIKQNVYQEITNKMDSIYRERKQKIHLVTLAGHTNIGILLRDYPQIKNYIEEVSGMFGSINGGNTTPNTEQNAHADPEGTHILLNSGLKVVMLPMDLYKDLHWNDDYIHKLKSIVPQTQIIESCIQKDCYDEEEIKLGLVMFDISAIFYVIDPQSVQTQHLNVVIEWQSQYSDGCTVVDKNGISGRSPNVHVAFSLDNAKLYQSLINSIYKSCQVLIK